jgi:hypothetical protein
MGELLELGVSAEDLSVVTSATKPEVEELEAALRTIDEGQVHLADLRISPGRVQEEGLATVESVVGGGIETIDPDDDVSDVAEMDDGSDVAENQAEPLNERWYGRDDEEDARRFAETGTIDLTHPTGVSFADLELDQESLNLVSARVVGQAMVLGDGAFATEVLTAQLAFPHRPADKAVQAALYKIGVAPAYAVALGDQVRKGGAVLTATEAPGRVRLEAIEEAVLQSGGHSMKTFVQVA